MGKKINLHKLYVIFLVFIVLTTKAKSSCLSCSGSYNGNKGSKLITTQCGHEFHLYCITQYLDAIVVNKRQNTSFLGCPTCNKLAVPLVSKSSPHIYLKSAYCETAEMHACRLGDLKKLTRLLIKDKRWDKNKNISLLHIAAKYGNENCLQAIINAGGSSNATIADGATPLHMAVENAHVGCVDILLNASANINAGLKFSRITPIYIAILKGNTECINLLLLRGQVNMDESIEPDGATLLYIASMNGDIKVVKYLLNANANINLFVDNNAWKTPLYAAIYNGNDDCVYALIKAGADFRAKDINTSQTYLGLATINGYKNIVQCLIREDLSLQKLHINTPLDDDISLQNVFSSMHDVSKLKCKEDYIQQKIKKLSSENRSYSVRNYSYSDCPKKVTAESEIAGIAVSSIYRDKSCMFDQVSASHSSPCFLSYFSKGDKVNNNCKVTRNDKKIGCLHFSHWWVSRRKPNFNDINSLEKIRNNYEVDDHSILNKSSFFKGCPSVAFYFETHQLPKVLHKVAITLKEGYEHRYKLFSINHVMGLSIKKSIGNIIILYYDPNDTLRHKKIIISNEDKIKILSVDDLWPPEYQQAYFPKNHNAGCLVSIDTKINRSDCMVECMASPSGTLMYLLNKNGHYGHPRASINLDFMEKKIKCNILSGKNHNGTPALFVAFQNRHDEAVRTYIETVLNSNLEPDEEEVLLIGKAACGSPALFLSIQDGNCEVTKTYINTIMRSKIKPDVKERLVAGKRDDGTPAFFMAVHKGHCNIIKSYFEEVLSSNIEAYRKERLLVAKADHSLPALFNAFQNKYPEAIKVYVEAVIRSNLKLYIKERMLTGINRKRMKEVYLIMIFARSECTKAFKEAILNSHLKKKVKKRFLSIK